MESFVEFRDAIRFFSRATKIIHSSKKTKQAIKSVTDSAASLGDVRRFHDPDLVSRGFSE